MSDIRAADLPVGSEVANDRLTFTKVDAARWECSDGGLASDGQVDYYIINRGATVTRRGDGSEVRQ
jgi:hypothetical protein